LFCASLVQAVITLNVPTFQPTDWQAVLLMDAVLIISMIVNTWLGFILPTLEVMIFIVHIIGFFAVLVPMASLSPIGSVNDIFTTFFNGGGWPSQGLSFCIGIQGLAAAFLGEIEMSLNELLFVNPANSEKGQMEQFM
jgi:choline transport protein